MTLYTVKYTEVQINLLIVFCCLPDLNILLKKKWNRRSA